MRRRRTESVHLDLAQQILAKPVESSSCLELAALHAGALVLVNGFLSPPAMVQDQENIMHESNVHAFVLGLVEEPPMQKQKGANYDTRYDIISVLFQTSNKSMSFVQLIRGHSLVW